MPKELLHGIVPDSPGIVLAKPLNQQVEIPSTIFYGF